MLRATRVPARAASDGRLLGDHWRMLAEWGYVADGPIPIKSYRVLFDAPAGSAEGGSP